MTYFLCTFLLLLLMIRFCKMNSFIMGILGFAINPTKARQTDRFGVLRTQIYHFNSAILRTSFQWCQVNTLEEKTESVCLRWGHSLWAAPSICSDWMIQRWRAELQWAWAELSYITFVGHQTLAGTELYTHRHTLILQLQHMEPAGGGRKLDGKVHLTNQIN